LASLPRSELLHEIWRRWYPQNPVRGSVFAFYQVGVWFGGCRWYILILGDANIVGDERWPEPELGQRDMFSGQDDVLEPGEL